MPKSVKEVFKENIQLLPRVHKTQVRQVRGAVRKFIYSQIKFLNYKDKETKEREFYRFDNYQGDTKVLRRANLHAYLLIKSIQWNHLDPIDQEIYWNTYRNLAESTFSANISSEISAVKKIVVTGKN